MKSITCLIFFGMHCLSFAGVIIATSFEPTPYTVGNLTGQNGWTIFGSGNPQVENSFSRTGLQAVSFNATGLSGQSTAINALTYSDAGGEKIIEATIAMYITPSASPTRWTALSFFSTNGFLAQLLVLDTAIIGNGPTTTGTLAINQGTWHSFRLHLDFASQTMTGYADSALIGELPFSILAHDLTQVRFGVNTLPGANTAYFDDLIITSATPEPTELTWLGLGAIIALLRRRKKAEHTNHHDF